jgi:predicted metalloprotease
MTKVFFRVVFAGMVFASVITEPLSLRAGVPSLDPADRMARAGLKDPDIVAVDRALVDASKHLSEIWKRIFSQNHLTYRSPTLKRYIDYGAARCGPEVFSVNNAFYCPPDDIIWYDPIFLARLKKIVAARSKQSADAVPTIVVAHEWGHAISVRLGFGKQTTGTNVESDADCYAGAATRELIKTGHLSTGALEQAAELFELLGQPDSQATGSFLDILSRSHGVVSERRLAFNFGADSGIKSCQNEKRYYDILRKVQRPIK